VTLSAARALPVHRRVNSSVNRYNCKTKAPYGKGEHSFKLLALIDPTKVANASPWANRFINELKKKMDA
jgi:hypothetical protein